MPSGGRGEYLKISKALKTHTSHLSHILRGPSQLTLEQACLLARHFGMSELETEYFVTLVEIERAGNAELRALILRRQERILTQSKEVVNRVQSSQLSEADRAIFYSNWFYSAIRLSTSIKKFQTLDAIALFLDLPRERVSAVLDFLVEHQLCTNENGKYQMGPTYTHLESKSPLALRHHANWRLKALERHSRLSARELAYTCPATVSTEDQEQIREELVRLIEKYVKKIGASTPEEKLVCLNLDWFEV